MLNNNMNLNYVKGMTIDHMINVKINKIFIDAYKNQFKYEVKEEIIIPEVKNNNNNIKKLVKGFCIAAGCATVAAAMPAAAITWKVAEPIRAIYKGLAGADMIHASFLLNNPCMISTMFYKL